MQTKEDHRKAYKDYYYRNVKKMRAKSAAFTQTPKGKFSQYRKGARKRNILWELTLEQFMTFWQKPCWYCKQPIETIGLDRIDNNLEYSVANVVSYCTSCNKAKLDRTQEEFITWIKQVYAALAER